MVNTIKIKSLPSNTKHEIAVLLGVVNDVHSERKAVNDVCSYVLESIYGGIYIPGSRINESAVAHKLGVSNIVVREAMERLIHLDWVERIPNKGIYLKKNSLKELNEIHEIRRMHERYAVRQMAKSLGPGQLRQLRELAEKLQSQDDNSYPHYRHPDTFMLDIRFHALLMHFSGNEALEKITVPLIVKDMLLYHIHISPDSILAKLIQAQLLGGALGESKPVEHYVIYEALAARDVMRAEQKVNDHLMYWFRLKKIMTETIKQMEMEKMSIG